MSWFSDLLRKLFGLDDEEGPHPGPTPVPGPLPPGPPAPPAPAAVPFQAVEGRVVLDVKGLAGLPLSLRQDDFVLAVLTWEQEGTDATVPILGIHIRGTEQKNAGFLLRWSPNILKDQNTYKAFQETRPDLFVGSGQNYHQRKDAGDGQWTITWSKESISVASPKGEVQSLKLGVPGSAGFGRMSTVLWERRANRYHLWQGFEASAHGVSVKLVSWTGKRGNLIHV